MTPFRERNPVPIAIVGILVLLALLVAAFNADKLPIIGGGSTYKADFADASGLKTGDDVRVAGIKVGKVDSIELHGTVVRVAFTVDTGTRLGSTTRADIKIKTLLGQKFLSLVPDGTGTLHGVIPESRTTTPLIVTAAFIGLSRRIESIDTGQLAKSFDTLANTFKDSPKSVHGALTGLARLSQTIASRDQQLGELLQHARGVTGVLAQRDAQVRRLIDDGDLVLTMVEQQRAVIHRLLVDTSALAQQLSALVQENKAQLAPALANLQSTLTILRQHEGDLTKLLHVLAPFVRDFTNTLGSGRWFDTFVANLPPTNASIIPNPQPTTGGG